MNGMTVQQAAEYHGVSTQTIYYYVWGGRIRAERFGSAHVLNESDVKNLNRRPAGRPRKTA